MSAFTHHLRVRYNECDPQGVVFNANYFTYFDILFTELWREAVGAYDRLLAAGLDSVVAEAGARFHGSAAFDDELVLEASVVRLGTTGITTEMRVLRDGELLVTGTLRHVVIGLESKRPEPMPEWVRAGLAATAGAGVG